jgi:hypothetical protein
VNKDLEVLVNDALLKEQELAKRADELALQSKQFADYLAAKKHADEELEVLWSLVKDYMIQNNYSEYDGEHISLKLTSSGKYKAEDIDSVDNSVCDIKKVLNNKKVKSYLELNGTLPEGVESTGYILRKTIKES